MIDHANRRKLNRVAVERRYAVQTFAIHGTWRRACTMHDVRRCKLPVNGDELDVNFLKDSKVTPKKYEAIGSRSAQRLRHAAAPMFRRNHSIRFRLPKLTTKEDIMVTEARETGTLIGSDKVEGTAVYGADDTKIGTIERVSWESATITIPCPGSR